MSCPGSMQWCAHDSMQRPQPLQARGSSEGRALSGALVAILEHLRAEGVQEGHHALSSKNPTPNGGWRQFRRPWAPRGRSFGAASGPGFALRLARTQEGEKMERAL